MTRPQHNAALCRRRGRGPSAPGPGTQCDDATALIAVAQGGVRTHMTRRSGVEDFLIPSSWCRRVRVTCSRTPDAGRRPSSVQSVRSVPDTPRVAESVEDSCSPRPVPMYQLLPSPCPTVEAFSCEERRISERLSEGNQRVPRPPSRTRPPAAMGPQVVPTRCELRTCGSVGLRSAIGSPRSSAGAVQAMPVAWAQTNHPPTVDQHNRNALLDSIHRQLIRPRLG